MLFVVVCVLLRGAVLLKVRVVIRTLPPSLNPQTLNR